MDLSIISITKNPGCLDVYEESFRRQTYFKDHPLIEWILVDENSDNDDRWRGVIGIAERLEESGKRISLAFCRADDYHPPRFAKICRSLNLGLSKASAPITMFWDDLVWIPDNCVEELVRDQVKGEGHRLSTLLRDRVLPNRRFVPYGMYSCFDPDYVSSPEDLSKRPRSWRETRTPGLTTNTNWWEPHVGAAPTDLLKRVGGFNEVLDYGYCYAPQEIAMRCQRADPSLRISVLPVRAIGIHDGVIFPARPNQKEACARNQFLVERTRTPFEKSPYLE